MLLKIPPVVLPVVCCTRLGPVRTRQNGTSRDGFIALRGLFTPGNQAHSTNHFRFRQSTDSPDLLRAAPRLRCGTREYIMTGTARRDRLLEGAVGAADCQGKKREHHYPAVA